MCTMLKPAPAAGSIFLTVTVKSRGRPVLLGSSENENCVFATHIGFSESPSLEIRGGSSLGASVYSTARPPYTSFTSCSTFASTLWPSPYTGLQEEPLLHASTTRRASSSEPLPPSA